MTISTSDKPEGRLAFQPEEIIDRAHTFAFSFNGKRYMAHPGDTIASALSAAGVQRLSRSFKYHRPRGLMCAAGHCPNCLVQVGNEPNVRACKRQVVEGMEVESQNVWPSLDADVMSLTGLADRFTPVGFYYKSFMRPKQLWPTYEKVLRKAAGLGRINIDAPVSEGYYKQYLHGDVVVVGGGPAGMSAALSAASHGGQVLLFEEEPALGGHARFSGDQAVKEQAADLASQIGRQENITVFLDSAVLGYWEDHWLSAVCGNSLFKIRAGAVIFATGAYEQPLVFDNNDLPGVMLASGVQRMLHLYGVAMGQRAVVVTANDEGWQTAVDLQRAGVEVAAILDQRTEADKALVQQVKEHGTAVYWNHTVQAAAGSGRISGVEMVPLDNGGVVLSGGGQLLACDLAAVSVGWAPANGLMYQAGVKIAYDESRGSFLPRQMPPGIFAAGRVTGTFDAAAQVREGMWAGQAAMAHSGRAEMPGPMDVLSGADSGHTTNLVRVPGEKKRFVCFCEDVTDKDLAQAIAEGYDSIELLKRYSTISMGPCQGKMCSTNTIHLCARAREQAVEETGTTVARPPMKPVTLASLAGQHMEPVKYTPVHDWHVSHGAKMMVAGLWMRAEHYGDPTAEIKAVRQAVGVVDVSTLGKLRLTGSGVPALLERLYTNRWRSLEPGRVRYGMMCNDEGIVMDDGVTARIGEQEWYMTTSSGGARAIFEWIQWWRQSGWGEGVHVTDLTEVRAAFNIAGPKARELMQRLTDAPLGGEKFPYMGVRQLTLAGVPALVMRLGFTGELSYELHCASSYGRHLWDAIVTAGADLGIQPFGVEAQRVLRLEKGHIIIGQDTDALSDPISAHAAWAVKLDKADFLGKRALTRISSEGPKQMLVGFKPVDSTLVPEEGLQIVRPAPGKPIGLESIGWVTSCRYSPTLNEAIGLCWLPAEVARQDGARFTIRREGQLVEAVVYQQVFYDPDGDRLRM